jgi:molecular chaperone DnaJ
MIMYDPYAVLGIGRNASADEIKKAYRALSRKYHPDANVNNPHKLRAEEQFKQIQQAYQQVMDEKEHGYRGSFDGFDKTYGQDDSDNYKKAAVNYIRSGHFKEALHVLGQISDHNAQWFYLGAIANSGAGNNVAALEYAKTAVEKEPANMEYQQLLAQLEGGGNWYRGMQRPYGTVVASGDGFCTKLCIANLVCNMCMGGSGMFC